MERTYQRDQLPEIHDILTTVGMNHDIKGDFCLTGMDPIIRSPHRLGYASAVAQGANALLLSMI